MPAEGQVISENDFGKIEAKMMELAKKNEPVVRREVSKTDALEEFKADGQTYKCEHIDLDLEDGTITTYTQGNFTDLCRGPHLLNTGLIKAVKITSVAGAFWRGDAKREQMTRIYGISFPKKKMLDEYLVMLEEAKKRDHRKIGKEMELFMFSDRVGKGLPIWLPKGTDSVCVCRNFSANSSSRTTIRRLSLRVSAARASMSHRATMLTMARTLSSPSTHRRRTRSICSSR